MTVQLVDVKTYQTEITGMMMNMLHLEPQPVDIPIQTYLNLEELGYLKPFLWFDDEIIKGVALIFVNSSMRNGAITDASTDVIWVKPEYRGNSKRFIDGIQKQLKQMGVNYWYISSRDSHPITGFLEKNEFRPVEKLYFKEV